MNDGPGYRSHSQLTTWQTCSEKYWLQRVDRVPEVPGLGTVAGKAIHHATEMIDNGLWQPDYVVAWQDALKLEVDAEVEKSGIAPIDWRVSGRKSKQWPRGEDWLWWTENGPTQIEMWHRWITNSGFTLLPEFIEAEFMADFGGGVMVKGYIDRVAVNPDGEVGVIDLKTGAYQPKGSLQLGTYRKGLAATVGLEPTWGAFFMTRKGILTAPVNLAKYTDDRLADIYGSVDTAIKAGVHWPNPNMLCKSCGVNEHCWAFEKGMDD